MTAEARGPFSDPDVQLMLRAKGGDEAAFEELVTKHRRTVLNLVYRYLGDASAAEDVAQDVFVRLHKVRGKYVPTAKFSTWLYRITVNHCLNAIRAQKARPAVPTPIDDVLEHPASEDPDARMNREEVRGAVRRALDALPTAQRMAVVLARFEDLSYGEIAETMNLSLEAVKSLLFRAKENLQQALGRFVK